LVVMQTPRRVSKANNEHVLGLTTVAASGLALYSSLGQASERKRAGQNTKKRGTERGSARH